MIKSMTGYGRSEISSEYVHGYVEVKTKNHKYKEVGISLPRKFQALEIPLQKILAKRISRGKVDLIVQISAYLKSTYSLTLNKELLAEYKKILSELKNEFGTDSKVDIIKAMQLNDLITTNEDKDTIKEDTLAIETAITKALDALDEMRSFEGEKLAKELITFIKALEEMTTKIQAKRSDVINSYFEKMKAKIANLLKDSNYDEQRLMQEVAYIVDKTDITEELARLKSHFSQFYNIIKEESSIGKKLDFLFQEMNREINTIASKANDFGIASIVIDMKNELEKGREQAQNIE